MITFKNLVGGDEVFIAAVSRLRKVFNSNKKWANREKAHQAKTIKRSCCDARRVGGVDNSKYSVTPCRFAHSGPVVCFHMQEATIRNIFIHM